MLYEHATTAAAWRSVNFSDAACTVPVRLLPVFASTVKRNVPGPDPRPASATVIQFTSLTGVHLHPDPVSIVIVTSCALLSTLPDVSLRRYVHVG